MAFAQGKTGRAFSLNGRSSSAEIAASPDLDMEHRPGFTISAWLKPTDVNGFHPIMEWYSTNAPGSGIGCQLRLARRPGTQGELVGVVVDMEGHYHVLKSPEGAVVNDRWQQVALTYDQASGAGALYLNGRIVSQARWKSFAPKTKGNLWISRRVDSSAESWTANTFFAGLLDEVAVYNRALSAGEIKGAFGRDQPEEETQTESLPGIDDAVWLKLDRGNYDRFREALKKTPAVLIVRPSRFSLAANPGIGTHWGWADGKMANLGVSFSELVSYGYNEKAAWDERMLTRTEFPPNWAHGHLTNTFDLICTLRVRPQERLQAKIKEFIRQEFGIAWHPETRNVEALLIKVKDEQILESKISRVFSDSQSFAELAGEWENYFGKPVLDETGLTNRYDRKLGLIPAAYAPGRTKNLEANNAFLGQYGLELVSTNRPMEWLALETTNHAVPSAQ